MQETSLPEEPNAKRAKAQDRDKLLHIITSIIFTPCVEAALGTQIFVVLAWPDFLGNCQESVAGPCCYICCYLSFRIPHWCTAHMAKQFHSGAQHIIYFISEVNDWLPNEHVKRVW